MIDDIWNRNRPYVIAEVSQNHDGSLGQAHAFIDAVATTGADAIKFQTHIASEESTIYEPFRVKFSYEDDSRYDYWKRMEFSADQWRGLSDHARSAGLDFLSSPFSEKALNMLDDIGVPAWKFGAGEVFNDYLLERAMSTGKPILISTGLSTLDEIGNIMSRIRNSGNRILLFQCVTAYPSTADMIDISQISLLRDKFNCPVGISDHSASIYPALAAVTLGARAIEVHVTLSPFMFGPDVKASVSIGQLSQIVEGSAFISTMLETKVNLSERSESREKLKEMFSKSLFASGDIHVGDKLSFENVKSKKPNIGIDSKLLPMMLGSIFKRDVKDGEPIKMEDFEK
ncbi:MAG: N-acetylneuraminate synthase family protein [Spirochaetales bacterium]|nr:N-acetylneuraminate synthase family protein [Spirochaetales bacterium]